MYMVMARKAGVSPLSNITIYCKKNIENNQMDRYYFGRSNDETDEYERIYTMGDSEHFNCLCILSWKLPQKAPKAVLRDYSVELLP